MSPAERLAELLDVEPRPTVEIVVAGDRFVARVRTAETFREGLLEVLLGRIELVEEVPAEADMRPSSGGRAAV